MLQLFERRPDLKSAHVFADHLEATLDLAEELELLHLVLSEPDRLAGDDVLAGLDRVGAFVERIEVLELAIAAKLELARAAARRIALRDARLQTFSKLFHSGTQPLVDLYPSLADPGSRIFDSGYDPLTFLQARGAIDESCCTLEGLRFLGTGEDYLLLGTVKLGAFIELCDTCLKAIDRHYHLYDDDEDWEVSRTQTIEILRERRDEAIRQALGVPPPVVEAPVEILPANAVDEAIDLIEGLTFPEEIRFAAEPPAPAAEIEEEAPLELSPEPVEEAPIELPADAVEQDDAEAGAAISEAPPAAALEEPVTPVATAVIEAPDTDTPVSIDEPVAAMASFEESALELACPADVPAAKPGLFAPLASARRSLFGFLARRRTTAETPGVIESEVAAGLDDEPESAQVEQAIEAIAADVAAVAVEDPVAETAIRQRLVDLIARRAAAAGDAASVSKALDTSVPATETPEPAMTAEPPSATAAETPEPVAEEVALKVDSPEPAPDSPPDTDLPQAGFASIPDDVVAVDADTAPPRDAVEAVVGTPRPGSRKRKRKEGRVPRRRRSKKA